MPCADWWPAVIGRPVDHRMTRLCAQSIMGQIVIYAHGRR